jgi:phospholipid transport system substrate-binding protein
MLSRRSLCRLLSIAGLLLPGAFALAQEAPDALVMRISTDVIDAVKADKAIQSGDVARIISLVDAKVMPSVNFKRMTASAVGRNWRQATPEQQQRLQDEFKLLLVRSYAGALTKVKDQTVELKPMRAKPEDGEAIVRTEIRGGGNEPVQLDYRLEKSTGQWRIYDVNVMGVWLVENYRNTFAQEISAGGIDGLIAKLAEKNKAASGNG